MPSVELNTNFTSIKRQGSALVFCMIKLFAICLFLVPIDFNAQNKGLLLSHALGDLTKDMTLKQVIKRIGLSDTIINTSWTYGDPFDFHQHAFHYSELKMIMIFESYNKKNVNKASIRDIMIFPNSPLEINSYKISNIDTTQLQNIFGAPFELTKKDHFNEISYRYQYSKFKKEINLEIKFDLEGRFKYFIVSYRKKRTSAYKN